MNVDSLLSRLEKVRPAGTDKYLACCPAHKDKTPSLAIKDAGDRVLLHCFAGCAVDDICAAIGIGVHDLFVDGKAPRQIMPGVSRKQLADALETEFLILAQCAHKRAVGDSFTDDETDRELTAWKRIDSARRVTQ